MQCVNPSKSPSTAFWASEYHCNAEIREYTLFTLNEVINNKLPNSPGDELQPTSDIASVQHRRLARKHSTPPLHVIGSKPAPSPFLTTSTLHKSSPPLNPCNIAAPASLSILESDPTTRAPNREHNGTPGRVGKKPVQAGAFRAGTPTNPYEEREKELRPTASVMRPDDWWPGRLHSFTPRAKNPCFARNKHSGRPSTTVMPVRTQLSANTALITSCETGGKSARAGGSSQPKNR